MSQLAKNGVQFYSPTEDELQQWIDKSGHQLDTWIETKKELAGSIKNFDLLLSASKTQSKYYVNDI